MENPKPIRPTKNNPDDFIPRIWSTNLGTESVRLLVCQKRMQTSEIDWDRKVEPNPVEHGPPLSTGSGTCEILIHPVAIELSHPVAILYGLPGNLDGEHRNWTICYPEQGGISKRAARAALCEAYRGVKVELPDWPFRRSILLKFPAPIRVIGHNTDKPGDMIKLRNVALWVNWDHWNHLRLSDEERADKVRSWGYPCTTIAVRRVREKIMG